MKKIFSLALAALIILLQAGAQQTFKKTVQANYATITHGLIATSDGGYLIEGETSNSIGAKSDIFVTKVDINGDFVWGRTIGTANYELANAIVTTKDGGFALAGSVSNAMSLTKLSAAGTPLWSKTYSTEKLNAAYSIIQTLDGGLAIGGYTQTDKKGSSGYFVKTDASGNVQWSKRIFDFEFYPAIHSIVQTKDSGYVCALNARNNNKYSDIFIVKIDKKGAFVWGRSIGGDNKETPQTIIATNDDGFAILATTYSFDSLVNANMYLIKMDKNADLQWSKTIGDTAGNEMGWGLVQAPDGGLIAVGQTSVLGEGYDAAYIAKIDLNGNLIYTKTVGNEKSDMPRAVVGRLDGGITIAGQTDFYSLSNTYDITLLKFDSNNGICGASGAGGVLKNVGATLKTKTVKILNATTTTGSSSLSVASGGLVTTTCSSTLPVKIIDFSASKNGSSNLLVWVAGAESDIRTYTIERSTDGIHFTAVGSVAAKENNNLTNNYSFTDLFPAKAINYYRLNILNKDGQTEYSIIRNVNNSGRLSVRLLTNPVIQSIPLECNSEKEQQAQIVIWGMDGRIYHSIQTIIAEGTSFINIPSAELPGGVFIINIKTSVDEVHIKFIK